MKKFAVFDIDGTLLRWQLYHATVNRLASEGALIQGAYKKIHQARMVWKKRENQNAFEQYEKVILDVFNQSLPNLSVAKFNNIVKNVIDEYKDQVYSYTKEQIKKLKQENYVILAISGSSQEMVELMARHFEFDDWVGSTYYKKGNKFSGEVKVVAHDKKTELAKLIKKHGLTTKDSWGFGDSKSDVAFLEMVDNPVAFNPDQHLFEIAKTNNWNIVIERKNVIYKLKADDGSYVLA